VERLNAMPVDIPADLEQQVRDHLAAHPQETWNQAVKELRRSRENYSDVILRLAGTEGTKATVVKLAERG
jgi:hypothetical protein